MARTRMGAAAILMGIALTATAAGASTALAVQAVLRGTWSAEMEGRREPRVTLRLDDGGMVTTLPTGDAAELVRRAEDGGVRWTLTREAGTLDFEGTLTPGGGRGVFSFRGDPAFREAMAALGYGIPSERDLMAAAVHDLTRDRARSLREGGIPARDFDDLLAAAIFDVDGDFLDRMEALGLRPDLDELVAFRIHGVTPTWVEAMREAGLEGDEEALVAFRIHGVTPEYVAEMREAGLGGDGDELVAFRIHGVTPGFARRMREAGLGRVEEDDLVAFRIHGVTREFVDDIREAGLGELDAATAVALRIHGVDRAWVESMREAGLAPADLDEAVAFRIHGVTPELVRALRERGYDDLDGEDLLDIRIHGLDRLLLRRPGG